MHDAITHNEDRVAVRHDGAGTPEFARTAALPTEALHRLAFRTDAMDLLRTTVQDEPGSVQSPRHP